MTQTPAWDDLRILLALHRDRSFLVAGRTLGMATSTVARRIAALARTAGRPLVHRANDGTQLDPDALPLVALAESLELGLDALRRDDVADDAVSGTVRLSMSEGFVRPVTEALARLRVKHPRLLVELMSESRLVDLSRREADIGIRVTPAAGAAVISRPMGRAKTGLFASRDYVARRLPTGRLLKSQAGFHEWVGLDATLAKLPQEQWMRAYGASRFVFRSNSSIALEHAMSAGVGIGLMVVGRGADRLGLVQLELEASPPAVEVYVAFHRDLKKSKRVRVVVSALEHEMKRQLA